MNQLCHDESQLVFPKLMPDLFFLYLLPPIILEASYCLHNRHFYDNLGAILLFAVAGTLMNFLLIGLSLCFIHKQSLLLSESSFLTKDLTATEIFLFSSLISAVDPVTVLSNFSEVGVNPNLYFLVFGESLLNVGVAVVLYNMMSVFAGMEFKSIDLTEHDILYGIGSFFTVALGGFIIGIIFGLLAAVVTKLTSGVRIVEPLFLLGGAYMAYITAELFHWSGILCLVGCGITQVHFAFKNISQECLTTITYFIKMLSSTSDCIIFLYVGIAFFEKHEWNTYFIVWTIFFCIFIRFLTIFTLSFVINALRQTTNPIYFREQFIMACGGLRDAVGFSLVTMISQSHVPAAQIFVTTTLAVIMFTVFLQCGSIRFIVQRHDIDRKKTFEASLLEELNKKVVEHVLSGIEVITGNRGPFYTQNQFNHYDTKYLKRVFCVKDYDRNMKRIFEKISLSDHFLHLYDPSLMSNDYLQVEDDLNAQGNENRGFEEDPYDQDCHLKKDEDLHRSNSLPISNTRASHLFTKEECC